MIASLACTGCFTISLTYDRPPADSAPIASMLIPASPRIAASFASSPGRSGTSMSIWIMSPREGHGSARLQALRAVAWRQIAYGMRRPHSSEFMRLTLAYVEIQVRDLERSISFYRDVLG